MGDPALTSEAKYHFLKTSTDTLWACCLTAAFIFHLGISLQLILTVYGLISSWWNFWTIHKTDCYLLQPGPCRLGTSTLDLQAVLGSSTLEGNSLITFAGARLCLWVDILLSGYILNNRIILNVVMSVLSFKALSSY